MRKIFLIIAISSSHIFGQQVPKKNEVIQQNSNFRSPTDEEIVIWNANKIAIDIHDLRSKKGIANDRATLLGYYSKGDGGGGEFYWDATSTELDNSGTVFQVEGIAIGRWVRLLDKDINAAWFGAKPDGITDNTMNIQNAINYCQVNNLSLVFRDGTWITNELIINGNLTLVLRSKCIIKLKDRAANKERLSIFSIKGSNVKIEGGIIDFNRNNQAKSFFNSFSSTSGNWNPIRVTGTSFSPIESIYISTKIINSVDFGIYCAFANNVTIQNTEVSNSGAGIFLANSNNSIIINLILFNLNNDNWRIYPHGLDILKCHNTIVNNFISVNQTSYGNTANKGSLSDYGASCFTAVSNSNLIVNNCSLNLLNDNNQTPSIGISWFSNTNCFLNNFSTKGFTAVSLELGSNSYCHFTNGIIDGNWQSNIGSNFITGISIYGSGFYENFLSRSVVGTNNCNFENITIKKLKGYGIYASKFSNCNFSEIKSIGNRIGAYIDLVNEERSFNNRDLTQNVYNTFFNCDFNYNEVDGISLFSGVNLMFKNCRFIGNGQAKSIGALRIGSSFNLNTSGIATYISKTSGALLDKVTFTDCVFADEQKNFNTISSGNISNPNLLTVAKIDDISIGQTLSLKGAGKYGQNLVVQVLDKDKDEIMIDKTIITFPLTKGTGNISSNGTSLIGKNTLFNQELKYRTWIYANGEYRQIIKQNTANEATINKPFKNNINDSPFQIVSILVSSIPSQDYGLKLDNNSNNFTITNPSYLEGNILSNILNIGKNLFINDFIVKGSESKLRMNYNIGNSSGSVNLVAGKAIVNTNIVTANSKIFITVQEKGECNGRIRIASRVPGSSFTIQSSDNTDNAQINWLILN